MLILILLSVGGLIAGFLLLRTLPTVPTIITASENISIIIPARNEAANLPPLLTSIHQSPLAPAQILVIDDDSTDATASIASKHGATVIRSTVLPAGWTGKTWALHQGAAAAKSGVLFFLDADTYFVPGGYARIATHYAGLPPNSALSILPFHRTQRWYEQLSVFFNVLVAMGAGGFGKLDPPHLFGQSLLIRRHLYDRVGGHASVQREILENLHLAAKIRAAHGSPHTLAGRGTLEMRMFPEGLAQLCESWRKAFSVGASVTSPLVLALSIFWLFGAALTAILAIVFHTPIFLALYLATAAQIWLFARQLGTFHLLTALFYPIPLAFYFTLFAQALLRRNRHQPIAWRGRQL